MSRLFQECSSRADGKDSGAHYRRGAVGMRICPRFGDDQRPFLTFPFVIPLLQAVSSPNSLHSFDETTSHARDAPRRVLSHVLFRGVVTPGLGMNESRAFFVDFERQPQPTQG